MGTPEPPGQCPAGMKATSNGAFQNENPLDYALPLLIVQILLVVTLSRILAFIIKPLRQPRVIAEIIGGILLGPSAIGRSKKFMEIFFPVKSISLLETLANVGLLFFLFLVGLELDMRSLKKTGGKALAIAVGGISLPFAMGAGTSVVLRATICKDVHYAPFLVFMGVALSITAFPVLARILAELKLLTTDVGRIAMSAAAVNDVAAWIFLALAIALSGSDSSPLISVWVLLCGAAFVLFAFFVLKIPLSAMASHSLAGEPVKEIYICITLSLVLAASFVTDTIGIHALFGAFVVGVVIPKEGPFAGVLIEKLEDIISGIFLPLYFAASGLKTDVATIKGGVSWAMLALIICTACIGKIAGTMAVSISCKVPFREALALGLLMNTKGLVELIVLNIGKDRKVLNDQTFAICVLMALFTTFMTTPLVMTVYRPARKSTPYKHKTIQRKDIDTELRLVACFYSTRNIPSLINLIESSRGTRKSGKLCVYAMHLMELSERSSAITMVHKARYNGLPFWNAMRGEEKDSMVIAFESYGQLNRVKIRPMTAISSLDNIHEDICTSAHQKHAAMIILPFHKHQKLDGTMEHVGHPFHVMNELVLSHAPCSVGIMVDRGLGGTTQVSASDVSYTVVVPFFGGRDDREAIAYGLRIAEHPGIKVTVVRFLASGGKTLSFGATLIGISANQDKKVMKYDDENNPDEKEEDDKAIAEFSIASSHEKEDSIVYVEKLVESKEDIITVLKEMNKNNLFLVGRVPRVAPLLDKSDSKELGPVGCFLASSYFSTTASVLVIQQYNPDADLKPLVIEEDTSIIDMPDTPVAS